MSNKKLFDSENVPAWARYNGETYIAGFSGTAKQKRESEYRGNSWDKLVRSCINN